MSPETYLRIGIIGILGFAALFRWWVSQRDDLTIYASFLSLIVGLLSMFAWFLGMI